MQRAAGLCKNIHKPSIYKEYKDIRKEAEEDAGAAGLKKQRSGKACMEGMGQQDSCSGSRHKHWGFGIPKEKLYEFYTNSATLDTRMETRKKALGR